MRRSQLDSTRPALVVDALVGYNLRGAPRPEVAAPIHWAVASGIPVLSLDVPSGVDATTGEIPDEAVRATWTLTLALPKIGLRPDHAGALVLADLGIPAAAFRRAGIPYTPPFGKRYRVPLQVRAI